MIVQNRRGSETGGGCAKITLRCADNSDAMTPSFDLSIIIVSWNTRELLHTCLRSVYAGMGSLRCEVLVVDNHSEDGSAEMVAKCFPQVRLIQNDTNRGFAAANNQALGIARGRSLLLLNSDTEILGEVLPASCHYLDEHEEIGVLGVRVLNPDHTLQPTCFRDPSLVNLLLYAFGVHRFSWPKWCGRERMIHWDRNDERVVDVVTGCFLLARRDACVAVGLLDEQFFFYGEEADWCRRFRAEGWGVCFAPVGEIIHYGGASTKRISHRRLIMLAQAQVRYLGKYEGMISAVLGWLILGLAQGLRGRWGSLIHFARQSRPRSGHAIIPSLANSEPSDERWNRAA